MKLATYHDGSRDGQLVVVSRDLAQAHFATGIATRLQQVMDDWNFLSPQLEDLSATLNGGKARHAFAFDPRACRAPLPRAYRWAWVPDPAAPTALVHGPGDPMLGPRDHVTLPVGADEAIALAGFALVTGDLPPQAPPERVLEAVRLTMLFSAWRTSGVDGAAFAADRTDGAAAVVRGPFAFAAVAATPDELGEAWQGGRVLAPMVGRIDGQALDAECTAAGSVAFAPVLLALTARGPLRAGSVVGSVVVSQAMSIGTPAGLGPADDDVVNVAFKAAGRDGHSIWGAIEQRVRRPRCPRPSGSP